MILARLRALYCALLAWLAAATMESTGGRIQHHGIATA
jgi:hypothetical protein